jgi:hypothetical protein
VSRFRILRFMDWLSTNHSANAIVSWADRPTRDRKPTEAEGARWETIVELANTVRRDPWINIPVRANDDYVRNLATLLRDTLDPALAVYVEYSNEIWNGTFDQFAINRDLRGRRSREPLVGAALRRRDRPQRMDLPAHRQAHEGDRRHLRLGVGCGRPQQRVRIVLAGRWATAS